MNAQNVLSSIFRTEKLLHHQFFSYSRHFHFPCLLTIISQVSFLFSPLLPLYSSIFFSLVQVHSYWICQGQDPIACYRAAIVSIFTDVTSITITFSQFLFSRLVLYHHVTSRCVTRSPLQWQGGYWCICTITTTATYRQLELRLHTCRAEKGVYHIFLIFTLCIRIVLRSQRSARESCRRVDDRRGVTGHVHVSLLSRFGQAPPSVPSLSCCDQMYVSEIYT